ncbi:hypothetical protein CL632_03140 [bacterium]|nr:hypothetical protein [bacterium]
MPGDYFVANLGVIAALDAVSDGFLADGRTNLHVVEEPEKLALEYSADGGAVPSGVLSHLVRTVASVELDGRARVADAVAELDSLMSPGVGPGLELPVGHLIIGPGQLRIFGAIHTGKHLNQSRKNREADSDTVVSPPCSGGDRITQVLVRGAGARHGRHDNACDHNGRDDESEALHLSLSLVERVKNVNMKMLL